MPNSGFWDDGLDATKDRLNACLVQRGTLAARPQPGQAGRRYVLTNAGLEGKTFVDTGIAWTELVGADAAAATASLRTLGSGALQAAAGNHTHNPTEVAKDEPSVFSTGTVTSTSGFTAISDTETTVRDQSRTPGGANRALVGAAGYIGIHTGITGGDTYTVRLYLDGVLKSSQQFTWTSGTETRAGVRLWLESNPSVASHTFSLRGIKGQSGGTVEINGNIGIDEVKVS